MGPAGVPKRSLSPAAVSMSTREGVDGPTGVMLKLAFGFAVWLVLDWLNVP